MNKSTKAVSFKVARNFGENRTVSVIVFEGVETRDEIRLNFKSASLADQFMSAIARKGVAVAYDGYKI